MKNIVYIFFVILLVSGLSFSQNIWINEFSYDCADSSNGIVDGDEFVEIVAPVGTDMSDYGLIFYFYSDQDEVYYANYYSQLSGTVSLTNTNEGNGFFIVKTGYSDRLEQYSPIPLGITKETLVNAELFNDLAGLAIITASDGDVIHAVFYELPEGQRAPQSIQTEKYVETPGDWQISEISLIDKPVDEINLPVNDNENSTPGGSISMIGTGFSRLWTITNGDANNFSTPGNLNFNQSALPVELSSFTVKALNNTVKLNWRTETEVNNYGFDIERKAENSNWSKLSFVNGSGNSNSPKDYSYNDNSVKSGKYIYRLKQIDNDGQFVYSNSLEVSINKIEDYSLAQNYPNPFNPATKISFSLPKAGNVKLTIFNLLGQEVVTLVNGYKDAGDYSFNFDAKNLNSGIYVYKLETNNFTQTRKMTLIK